MTGATAALTPTSFHPSPRSDGNNCAAFSVAGVAGAFLVSVKTTVPNAHKERTPTSAHGISLRTNNKLLRLLPAGLDVQ